MTDLDERPEPDRPSRAWCPSCLLMIRPKWTDFGVGLTEAWGVVQRHRDMRLACPECDCTGLEESEPVEGGGE